MIVAGKNFGNNSSREQAVHVLRMMGVAGIVANSFGRQFFRNCINNGLPVVECNVTGIAENDEIELDLALGRVAVPARGIVRETPPLPAEVGSLEGERKGDGEMRQAAPGPQEAADRYGCEVEIAVRACRCPKANCLAYVRPAIFRCLSASTATMEAMRDSPAIATKCMA